MTAVNTSLPTLPSAQPPHKSSAASAISRAPVSAAAHTSKAVQMPEKLDNDTKVSSAAIGKKSSKHGDLTNPKGVLGKDDFLKLLLTELQYQDPTQPMDTEKILAQTSQLATLESSNNTNKSLAHLAKAFSSSQQFATISAIGKIADLGDDTIKSEGKGKPTDFDLYIPTTAKSGTVTISDANGNAVDTMSIGANQKGVYQFTWNGKDSKGDIADAGVYHVSATYTDSKNQTKSTKVGTYPIDSVKFDGEKTLLKVGSNYVPLSKVAEVY